MDYDWSFQVSLRSWSIGVLHGLHSKLPQLLKHALCVLLVLDVEQKHTPAHLARGRRKGGGGGAWGHTGGLLPKSKGKIGQLNGTKENGLGF